jgi:disulfide bond formation protein DsbB
MTAPKPTTLVLLAAGGSLALLLGALVFQTLGYAPCKLCIWQRWPHGAAIAVGLLWLALRRSWLLPLGTLAALATSAVGAYHTGVEQKWWQGPATCSAGPIGGQSSADLLDQIMNAPLIRCDEVSWAFAGLSMATWNAILSLGLALLWLAAWRRA